jgi:hypothetical protein
LRRQRQRDVWEDGPPTKSLQVTGDLTSPPSSAGASAGGTPRNCRAGPAMDQLAGIGIERREALAASGYRGWAPVQLLVTHQLRRCWPLPRPWPPTLPPRASSASLPATTPPTALAISSCVGSAARSGRAAFSRGPTSVVDRGSQGMAPDGEPSDRAFTGHA